MKIILLLLFLSLCGCAVNTGIIKTGADTYFVSRQAATGFTGIANLKAKALKDANEFCNKKGKDVEIISIEEAKPPYIFGNFPRVEVQFRCIDK